LLEVLFLGNRAVAHPDDGGSPDHQVDEPMMTAAINVVLRLLVARAETLPNLMEAQRCWPQFFTPFGG
jgi:hypothetical protein